MEESEEREDDRRGYGAYAPPVDRYGSSIVTLTNPKETLEKFELFLRCLREDSEGKLVRIGKEKWKPLLNDIGINRITSVIEAVMNDMTALSNYEERDMEKLYNHSKEILVEICIFSRVECKIDRKNRDLIVGNSLNLIYGFMKRAYQEGERKFWRGSLTEIHHTQEINKPKTGGGFNINPFAWGKK